MVPIGSVKIADVIGRILEGSVADAPLHPGKGRGARAAQFDLRGAEEGHWEITAQSYPVTLVADDVGESLHQVFPVLTIVKGSGAVEQGNGRVDGGLGPVVPGDAKSGAGKSDRLFAGHGKFEKAQHGSAAPGRPDRDPTGGWKCQIALFLAHTRRARLRCNVRAGPADQIQHILVRGRLSVPTDDRAGQFRAWNVVMIDVIAGA